MIKMELKIKTQVPKQFLGRKELVLEGHAETTPSKAQLKEEIAKMASSPAEMVVIKKVRQQFGKKDFLVDSYVYDSEKSFKEFENTKKKAVEGAK